MWSVAYPVRRAPDPPAYQLALVIASASALKQGHRRQVCQSVEDAHGVQRMYETWVTKGTVLYLDKRSQTST